MSALEELFWRDEILQALFWMRGEGLGERVAVSELARFLAVEEQLTAGELAKLAADGYVEADGAFYRLTPLGVREGGRRFQDEFAELTRQAHAECGPGCWCHDPEHEGEPCPNREPEPQRALT